MTDNYLNVLEESLQSKLQIMAKIQEYNLYQQEIFQAQDVDLQEYEKYVDMRNVGPLLAEVYLHHLLISRFLRLNRNAFLRHPGDNPGYEL